MSIIDCYHQMIIYDHQLYIFGLICNTPWISWYLCEKFDSALYYIITLQHAKHTYCRESADLYISAIKSSQPCCKYFMSVGELGRKRKTQKKQKESSTFNSTEITSDSQSLTDTHTHKHKPWAMSVVRQYTHLSLFPSVGGTGQWRVLERWLCQVNLNKYQYGQLSIKCMHTNITHSALLIIPHGLLFIVYSCYIHDTLNLNMRMVHTCRNEVLWGVQTRRLINHVHMNLLLQGKNARKWYDSYVSNTPT